MPVAYAAKGMAGEDVVRYLLERGRRPDGVKDCWGSHDGLGLAEFYGNNDVARGIEGVDKGSKWWLRPTGGENLTWESVVFAECQFFLLFLSLIHLPQ